MTFDANSTFSFALKQYTNLSNARKILGPIEPPRLYFVNGFFLFGFVSASSGTG